MHTGLPVENYDTNTLNYLYICHRYLFVGFIYKQSSLNFVANLANNQQLFVNLQRYFIIAADLSVFRNFMMNELDQQLTNAQAQEGELLTKPTKDIYLAGGCFWGTEHYFKQIEGVALTEVGFANGHTENPTYKEVYTDQTGFAETVLVRYYPDVVSLEFLLQMFFKAIDPTSLNKQGHDEGTRYRTGVYYTDPEDLPVIEKVFADEQKNYEQPMAVEKLPLQNFYTAEEYHQDYLDKNPDGYCHLPLSLFEFARKAKPTR